MDKSRTALLIGAWFDGALTAAEKTELEELLRSSGEARALFWKVAQTHVLLREAGARKACGAPLRSGAVPRAHRARFARGAWLKIAAAAALFVAAAVIWHGVPRASSPVSRLTPTAAPVTVVAGAGGLELPSALPGTVRLTEGTAKVRLSSGVEMSLMGPTELRVESGMEARLEAGRLLAWVPPRAGGLMIHAPGLTVWDIGTVFSVTTLDDVSDVFVFKGQVQVTDAEGGDVGLCGAGEGARARAGRGAVKTAADWDAARRLFASVAGYQAVWNPVEAVSTAGQICDLWEARHTPTVVPDPPPPVPGLQGMAAGNQQDAIGNWQSATEGFPEGRGSPVAGQKTVTTTPARESAPEAKQEEEMRGITKTAAAVAAAATLGAGAASAQSGFDAEVSGVTMTQREYTRIVDIGYTLTGGPAIITLAIETNGVAIPDSAVTRLSGAVSTVIQPGTHTITWNAGADWPENEVTNARARVTAWSTNAPPQVMVVDLTGGANATTYPVYYYTSVEALPGGGVTNSVYKSTHLVMRKICMASMAPYGVFNMGEDSGVKQVTLTQSFYVGVFEVTQGQWHNVMGSQPAYFTDVSSRAFRPVESVSYNDIRGSNDGAGWPTNDAVDAGSFMGKLRSKTGLAGLDLPTDAQWEYACRAGTTTYFSDGDSDANASGANLYTNAWLDALGRYKFNGGHLTDGTPPEVGCGPLNGTAIVGSYAPNAWGLYDTHGNVHEWCLNWFGALTSGDDPKGPDSGTKRVRRGGGWCNGPSDCRSAYRTSTAPSDQQNHIGFRLFRTLL
jgi:formylglycine-generating enzyme required for sulfatase activity